jgi:ABC-type transport system involved in cytochrome c biogenesis permease subunit
MQPLIDPAGYRYITLGLAALTLVLIINIKVFSNTGWDPFGSWTSTIAILAFCIVATGVMFWSMYKSIQK